MRVVLGSIWYPMSISRYFEAALRRRDDVELYTAGPYTGTWIPWNSGMNLPVKYAKAPDLPLPGNTATLPIDYVEKQLPWQPDLWLQIDAGWHLRGKPAHGKNVIVGTDPHCLDYSQQRSLADTFYCMQACYSKPGDVYLPYAYDPEQHYPEEQPRNYDACLLGLHYDNRNLLVNELRLRGVKVMYDLGPVFDERRELECQAPISLAWSSRDDLIARVFEGLAMGRLVVTNRVPDLSRFFQEDEHLIAFSSLGEATEKIMYYLNSPEETEEIAKAGREWVKLHTWDDRICQILEGL
jgi:glycosyltransferase involved in cell wall biosynthesis